MIFRVERKQRIAKVWGYGGRYEVGDLGKVYSGGCEMSLIDGRFVKLCVGGRPDRWDVAYLVARAFLPNPEGRPWVVHKDGDRRNNRVENLEWSERREPVRRVGRLAEARVVLQFDGEGRLVGKYRSVREASEKTGVTRGVITRSAAGVSGRKREYEFRYEG